MRFIPNVKSMNNFMTNKLNFKNINGFRTNKLNLDTFYKTTIPIVKYSGGIAGACGGARAIYYFSPQKEYDMPKNSTYLIYNVFTSMYFFSCLGIVNGVLWPFSIPCWIYTSLLMCCDKYIE